MTRVTVLIDTYNHARFIEQALDSVLAQDYPAHLVDVLVVDDGSTDDTPQRVSSYGRRVKYLRKENGGQATAFNFGLQHADGDVVAFLDGDDWWDKHKLSTVVKVLELNPEVAAVGHGIHQVEQEIGRCTTYLPRDNHRLNVKTAAGARLFRHLRCFLGTSRLAVRRRVLPDILPCPLELAVEADEWIFTLAAAYGDVIILAQGLTYYRLHDANLFQFRGFDEKRVRRRIAVMECLISRLPPRLAEACVEPAAIEAMLEPLLLEAEEMRLSLDGGSRRRVFQIERATQRLSYARAPWSYRLFKLMTQLLALLLPPRAFYRAKSLYSRTPLRALRGILGEPALVAPIESSRGSHPLALMPPGSGVARTNSSHRFP